MNAEYGPYDTEQQAREAPAARAWREAFDRDPGAGKGHAPNFASLTAACEAAGVTLGDYDRRIVSWLAGWEPTTVAVVVGLIARAHQAGADSAAGLVIPTGYEQVFANLLYDGIKHAESMPLTTRGRGQASMYRRLRREMGLGGAT